MTREEKIKLAIQKGFTYDENTGKIYGVRGKEIKSIRSNGYISVVFIIDEIQHQLLGHQFAYYIKYGKVVDYIDHINCNKSDNRIYNLREINHQQNQFNRKDVKGYSFNGYSYTSQIQFNGKKIHLGSYDNENDARQAYIEAKKIYHNNI